jgi:hypothetical protein
MTELKSALSRELLLGKVKYKLTVSPQGLKLVLKGKRNGLEIAWNDLINGDAAMAVALRASLHAPLTLHPASAVRHGKKSPVGKRTALAGRIYGVDRRAASTPPAGFYPRVGAVVSSLASAGWRVSLSVTIERCAMSRPSRILTPTAGLRWLDSTTFAWTASSVLSRRA